MKITWYCLFALVSLVFWVGQAESETMKFVTSGRIQSVSAKEVVIQSSDETRSFSVTKSTKICIGGAQVTWKALERGQKASVISEGNSKVALEIYQPDLLIGFNASAGTMTPQIPECIPKESENKTIQQGELSSNTSQSNTTMKGLNITRKTIQSTFEGIGVKFDDPGKNQLGEPSINGFLLKQDAESKFGTFIIIAGPPDNIRETSINTMLLPPNSKHLRSEAVKRIINFAKLVVPAWKDSGKWIDTEFYKLVTDGQSQSIQQKGCTCTLKFETIKQSGADSFILTIKAN